MATQTKVKPSRYVVLADAVVVTTGKKANGKAAYARVLKGGLLTAPATNEEVQTFLRIGSIQQVKSQDELDAIRADLKRGLKHPREGGSKFRLRPEVARRRSGAPDDPVLNSVTDVLPLDPDPDPMTAEQVAAEVESARLAIKAAEALGDE
jgi:hypothetical protein